MNNEVKSILDTITTGSPAVAVPNALLFFDGQADTFVVYSPTNDGVGLFGDDRPIELAESWDIDIYSKTNYVALRKSVVKAFVDGEWAYQGKGQDTFDETTGLYHCLLQFEKEADTSYLEPSEGEE
jgi:hypothetical protein